MVVDRNVAPKYTIADNTENGQGTAHMVFTVLNQDLNRFKFFLRDDRRMMAFVEILIPVLIILFVFMLKQICGKCFPRQYIAAISLVRENI